MGIECSTSTHLACVITGHEKMKGCGQMFGLLPSNRQFVPDIRAQILQLAAYSHLPTRSTHYFSTCKRVSICGSASICDRRFRRQIEIRNLNPKMRLFPPLLALSAAAEKVFIAADAALSRFCSLIAILLRRQTIFTHTCLTQDNFSREWNAASFSARG